MIHAHWGWLALVGSAVLLPEPRGRRLAAAGLGIIALALGALQVSGGPGRLPGTFAAVELALVLVGFGVMTQAMLSGPRPGWYGSAVLAVPGLGLLWGEVRAIASAAPLGGTAAALGVIGGTAVLAWAAVGWVLKRVPPPGRDSEATPDARWYGCAAFGVLLTAFGRQLFLPFAGVLLAAVAVVGVTRPLGFRAALPLVLVLATLSPAWWLFSTIASDQSLAVAALPDLPLSPAAEALLAPLLLVAAWALAGLWPLPRSGLSGLAGLAGLVLLGRVAVAALPQGLDHWRALAYPIVGLGLWHATAFRRWPAVMLGAAFFALSSGATQGLSDAWWLGGGALATTVADRSAGRMAGWLPRVPALMAGYGSLGAIADGLGVEVVYTTLIVAGIALVFAAGCDGDKQARAGAASQDSPLSS